MVVVRLLTRPTTARKDSIDVCMVPVYKGFRAALWRFLFRCPTWVEADSERYEWANDPPEIPATPQPVMSAGLPTYEEAVMGSSDHEISPSDK